VRVRLHPEARDELRASALWYDERRAGLGGDLVAEVAATLDRLAAAPRSFPHWTRPVGAAVPVHKAVVPRFPYVIGFEVHPEVILVLAVAHAKRRPLYWLTRAGRGPA
jgi:plasmid stabilization system protein ParE